jgi:hypothetical protein
VTSTESQIETPAELTRSIPVFSLPKPFTMAWIIEPAGDPVLGVI